MKESSQYLQYYCILDASLQISLKDPNNNSVPHIWTKKALNALCRFNKITPKIIPSWKDVNLSSLEFENLLKNWSIFRFGCKMGRSGKWAFEVKPSYNDQNIKSVEESPTSIEPTQLDDIPKKEKKTNQLKYIEINILTDARMTDYFLIDGDSLIAYVLEHPYLEIGQTLHAIYLLEKLLASFDERDCRFEIAFFSNHEQIWADKPYHHLFHLIAKLHLRETLKYTVFDFEDYTDKRWLQYLEDNKPYFILLHESYHPSLLQFTHWCLSESFRVASIADIRFTANEILLFDVFCRDLPLEVSSDESKQNDTVSLNINEVYDTIFGLLTIENEITKKNIALYGTICVVFLAIHNEPGAGNWIRLFLVAQILKDRVSLAQRALTISVELVDQQVNQLCNCCRVVCSTLIDSDLRISYLDLLDLRFFSLILQNCKGMDIKDIVDSETFAIFNSCWLAIENLLPSIQIESPTIEKIIVQPTISHSSLPLFEKLIPFKAPLLKELLGNKFEELDDKEGVIQISQIGSQIALFFETTHWHSTKPIHVQASSRSIDVYLSCASLQTHAEGVLKCLPQVAKKIIKRDGKVEVYRPKTKNRLLAIESSLVKIERLLYANSWEVAQQECDTVTIAITQAYLRERRNLVVPHEKSLRIFRILILSNLSLEKIKKSNKIDKKQIGIAFDVLLAPVFELFFKFGEDLTRQEVESILKPLTTICGLSKSTTEFPIQLACALLKYNNLNTSTKHYLQSLSGSHSDYSTDSIYDSLSLRTFSFRFRSFVLDAMNDVLKWKPNPISFASQIPLDFTPDAWQVQMINAVNANKSVIVTAPTSSGKTFIAFYVIEKLLRNVSDSNGVVVFVCPSRALVNQVYIDIYARFEKEYPQKYRTMLGIFTGEDRLFNFDCQVLICVPQCLEILLLSPEPNAEKWRNNLRYVVLDEIHEIGSKQGIVWEHLLCLLNCPFVGLSATIGNPHHFLHWIKSFRPDVVHVSHTRRPSELQYFLFNKGELKEIHPLALIPQLRRQEFRDTVSSMPPMSTKQLLRLYEVLSEEIEKVEKDDKIHQLLMKMSPENNKNFVETFELYRDDVRAYEQRVKKQLIKMINIPRLFPVIEQVVQRLREPLKEAVKKTNKDNITALVLQLQNSKSLPAIVFCLSKYDCDCLLEEVVLTLRSRKLDYRPDDTDMVGTALAGASKILIDGLRMGIGIHHSAIKKSYRWEVERLFRIGKLSVVIATGTLAMGIHMPCRTVVFAYDSAHLTPLQFFQMQGRAGRRGFDSHGNIVFFEIPMLRIHRLLTSALPKIEGHMPLNTTLVLRLMVLLKQSYTKSVEASVKRLLETPFFCYGKASLLDQVKHHLRFSIEMLMRGGHLNGELHALHFSGLLTHLFYTEPSNFVFVHLLREPYGQSFLLHSLDEKALLNVLCHLFNFQKHPRRCAKKKGSLPTPVVESIQQYNLNVIRIYSHYLSVFAKVNSFKLPKEVLPASKLTFPRTKADTTASYTTALLEANKISYHSRSVFSAMSGKNDMFDSKEDFAWNVRGGIIVEPNAIPALDIWMKKKIVYAFYFGKTPMQIEDKYRVKPEILQTNVEQFSKVIRKICTSLKLLSTEQDPLRKKMEKIDETLRVRMETLNRFQGTEEEEDKVAP